MTIRKTPTTSSQTGGILAPLTSRTIFSAASNTTGIKIHTGCAFETQTVNGMGHFVIATSAPSAFSDGVVISNMLAFQSGTTNFVVYKITDDTFVPSGYGLYWISNATLVSIGVVTDVSWSAA